MAERVRRFREERGWSVRRLAEECQQLGATELTVASLGNIERRASGQRKRRDVTVEELFVLGQALGVPPLLLAVPLGENEPLQLTSTTTVHPQLAWRSAIGDQPQVRTGGWAVKLDTYQRHRGTVDAFQELWPARAAYDKAAEDERLAENFGIPEQQVAAKERLADALAPFARAVDYVLQLGLEAPAYPQETVDALRNSGLISEPDRLVVETSKASE